MHSGDSWFLLAILPLILLSAFFSAAETGMMIINRYKLRSLAKNGQRTAALVLQLLKTPDRLLSIVLIGNTFANNLAASLATVVAAHYTSDAGWGVVIATVTITLVLLIFAEATPKTLAALRPEWIVFPAAWILNFLLRILHPLIVVLSGISIGILRLFGIKNAVQRYEALTQEELRNLVHEASDRIPMQHKSMLVRILDMQHITVEDIMVPRNEIVGIDINEPWDIIAKNIVHSKHDKLPVFEDSIDNVLGFVHLREIVQMLAAASFSREQLLKHIKEAHFVPEQTSLAQLIVQLQNNKQHISLVVNEYGEILGLVALNDVIEEVVGEIGTDLLAGNVIFYQQTDGSILVDGTANVRDLNRQLNWQLPEGGPKTLSGLIIEYLEYIPTPGTCLYLAEYPIEVVKVQHNTVKSVRIYAHLRKQK